MWRFWTGPTDNSSDRQWARRQAAEAQNHIFDRSDLSLYIFPSRISRVVFGSLGERYGLRIIPGANSFLVLPNNISRSTAVGAILHPGGPAHSPVGRAAWLSPEAIEAEHDPEADFVLAIGKDEKLMRRLNELENSETISSGVNMGVKGTDAKWKVQPEDVLGVLKRFAEIH